MKFLAYAILLVIGAGVAISVYVRLAPIEEGAYYALPTIDGPGDTTGDRSHLAVRQITTTPEGVLRAVQAAAEATPRTRLIEGSIEEERLVFVTRSLIWGFPDFTTVGIEDGMLVIHGRARYGQMDMGVNKARIGRWLEALEGGG